MNNLFSLSDIGLSTHNCKISEDKNTIRLDFSLGTVNKGRNLRDSLVHFAKCDRFFKTKIVYCMYGTWLVEVLMTSKIVDSAYIYKVIGEFLKTTNNSYIQFDFKGTNYNLNAETFEDFCQSPEIDREIKIKRWLDKIKGHSDLVSIPRFLKNNKTTVIVDQGSDHNFRSIGTRSDRYIEVLTACVNFESMKKVELYHNISPANLEKLERAGMEFSHNEYYIQAKQVIKLSELGS